MERTASSLSLEEYDLIYGHESGWEYWFGEARRKPVPTYLHGLLSFLLAELLRRAGYFVSGESDLKVVSDWQPSTYLHKSAYFGFGEVGWTTAFVHSNGAAVWLYALTNLSIAWRNCFGDVKLTPLSACWPRMLNQHST